MIRAWFASVPFTRICTSAVPACQRRLKSAGICNSPSTLRLSTRVVAAASEPTGVTTKSGAIRNSPIRATLSAERSSSRTATETLVTSSDSPYPKSRIRISGNTIPMAILLGSRRICRVSFLVNAPMRRQLASQSFMRLGRFARWYIARLFNNGQEGILHGGHVAGLGRCERAQLDRCTLREHFAVVQYQGSIAVFGLGHEMGGDNHSHTGGRQYRDASPKLATRKGVGATGRLVEEQNLRPMQECGRHGQALLESPG